MLAQTLCRHFDPFSSLDRDALTKTLNDLAVTGAHDSFLDQPLLVNFLVRTSDQDSKDTFNNWVEDYERTQTEHTPFRIHPQSSLRWLARQQGYRQTDIKPALQTGHSASPFLQSVVTECENMTTSRNVLVFFVQLSTQTFFDSLQNPGTCTLTPGTACGLYDFWNGAGGLLEITLEQPVTLPSQFVTLHVDDTFGYGVQPTYGMPSEFWTHTATWTPTPARRRALHPATQLNEHVFLVDILPMAKARGPS